MFFTTQSEEEKKALVKDASKLLKKHNFLFDGRPKGKLSKPQSHFEKRIIMTPMGNRSR